MRRSGSLFAVELLTVVVFLTAIVRPAIGQGLQTTLHARARVFPAIGPGVTALKRDSAGRYYVLAEPASKILVYDASGKRAGEVPNANSHGATIRYAVDIDVDSHDRLFVADRGANAVKIFSRDGTLAATIAVNAPTSVVALSDGQLAVTSLLSKRLVKIMDETGATIRSFGDPADVIPDQPGTAQQTQPALADRGRIIGDPAGDIYFAFTSLPDPTLQRFDRFGYSAYESVVPKETFGSDGQENRRVQLGYTMSALGWPESLSAWTDLHTVTSFSVSGHGQRGRRGQAAASSSSSSSGSSSTSTSASSSALAGDVSSQGNILAYSADSDSGDALDYSAPSDAEVALLATGPELPGLFGMGIGGAFHDGGFHERFGGSPGEAGPGPHPDFAGRLGGEPGAEGTGAHGLEGFHYHPAYDTYRAAATVRVYLDNPPSGAREKPVISAIGVDPVRQDVWAGIGDTLVHFDSGGARLEMYYLLLTDGAAMKPTAILVEPDRLLIAADPWGIYEFPRPDRPSGAASVRGTIVPQPIAPAAQPSKPTPASPQP